MARPEYEADLKKLTVLRRKLVSKMLEGGFDEQATIPQLLNANLNVYKMLAMEIDLLKEIEGEQNNVGSAVRKYEQYFATNASRGRAAVAGSSGRSRSRAPAPEDDFGDDSGLDPAA